MRTGMGVGVWAAACLMLLGYNMVPGRLSLQVGEPSSALIRAPRMAQYVDREATQHLRREAEQRVSPQYTPLPHARADAEKRVDQAFAFVEAAQKAARGEESLRRSLGGAPEASLKWALEASPGELRVLNEKARDVLRDVMSKEIREGTGDLKAAREEAEAAARRRESRPQAAGLLAEIVRQEVAANRRLDEDAFRAARAEARERVQEVLRTIEADHAIVFEGERVTREHLAMLQALGLTSPRLDYRRITSTVLLVGLAVLLLGVQTRHWAPPVYEDTKRLLLLSLLVVVPLFVINLLTLALPNVWMLIVPAAALVAAVLLENVVGMSLALVLSLLVGLMANAGLPAVLLSLGSAAAALAYASHIWPIARLRWIVGSMAATNLVLVAAIGLLQAHSLGGIVREAGLAALLYSPGAAVLGLGGIVLLQRPFGITTRLGLLELSNPQVPLLRRLQSEAPGTYHHSLMVANLAEAAAEAVGAEAMLARAGGLYHDIGKLGRPTFFVENQALLGMENAHERLSSSLSALIIISHVKDGLDLAREHRLPAELVDIIAQHHGTTLASYFYRQALGGERPEAVSEEQYRYPGPLPESKEAALVMLADSVQAAAKSIADPTPQRVQQMVREIVRERVVDGQLQACDLTFRDIAVVETTIARILAAVLCRTRIEYPESVAAS
ncbi:MAG: HDIG domain-containing protein [Armatimonadota bacterium]|nr:MAG: HDIG domain-containing protein [Armatimonadota bacterium]